MLAARPARTQSVEKRIQILSRLGAGFQRQANPTVLGPPAQLAQGVREHFAPSCVVRGGTAPARASTMDRAQLEGHGKGGISPADAVVELVGRVERPARRQREPDQRQLDRSEHMAQIARGQFRSAGAAPGRRSHRAQRPGAPSRAAS